MPKPSLPRGFFQRDHQAIIVGLVTAITITLLGTPKIAKADPYSDNSVPGRWLTQLLPEATEEPEYPDYDANNTIEKARIQMWAGQYRRALASLSGIEKPNPVDIAKIRAESRLALGRLDEALDTVNTPAVADDPGIGVLKARILAAQAKYPEAITTLKDLIAKHPDSIPAHYYLGADLEANGDIAGAKSAYLWFVTDPHNLVQEWIGHPDTFNSAEDAMLLGQAIDRWATLNNVYQTNRGLHDAVLSMFTRAYDLIDRDYWPAHVAAAKYFLAHDDAASATEELQTAMADNPFSIEAWDLYGKIQLEQFNFDGVDAAVDRIRNVDPDSIDADLLEARNFLLQRVPKLAMPSLNAVLARQPHNLEALGLLAGANALLLDDAKCAAILKQADQYDPTSAEAYFEVAGQLAAMRQYPRSAEMYKIAVDRAPWWADARNGLGLLYTQSGDEDLAKTVLEAAHELDPFNTLTTNYLRLLDQMDHFTRKESAHFIVIYDAKQDPMIPEYFSDYLETIYKAVTAEYKFEPKVKTMIEVFPTHDAFSVRTTGAPWIATVGASTGRIIALVAPRKGDQTLGTFNWSQVLRHEFTHTVTLGATDNRIAHWFTEGLAVQQEHTPMRWEWVPMLYQAVTEHQLFAMDALTWGFVRPRRPIDRQLAYAESSWICQYIEETYGHDAILKMLDEFRLGHGQDEVFQNVLNKSQTQFFDEFSAWCEQQVSTWGYDADTSAKYDALRKDGETFIKARDYVKAVPVFEEIAKIRPVDLLPHQRLAGLYMSKEVNQPQKAAEQLDLLARVELKNNVYAKGAARIYESINNLDQASVRALQAVFIDPYDMSAHQLLAEIYTKMGNTDGLDRENRCMQELTHWQEAATQPAQ